MITKEMQWHSNMTEQNHLGMCLATRPDILSGPMDRLFSGQNYYSNNPLSTLLNSIPHGEQIRETTEWEWELKGANSKPLITVECIEVSDNPGKYKRPFKIVLDENWYLPGDEISPGTSDKKYLCRVQDEVRRYGNGYEYTLVLMTMDEQEFLPKKYLQPGQKWSKFFSQYEEAADHGGSTIYSMPIAFANKMGKLRKEYRVTDYASTEVLRVAIPDSKGNYHQSWVRLVEVDFWQEWYKEKERALWYSVNTSDIKGKNGRFVRSGPGLQEMLKEGHTHRCTHLTTKLIEEYLMDIYYGRVKPGKGRNVKAFTGEYGMLAFHRAVQNWMRESGFVQNVSMFVRNVKSDLNPNALAGGYQFVRYDMANGCSLEVFHNPVYDDRTIHHEIDPVTGYPVESGRLSFFDFAGEGGKPNIQIMKKKDGFAFTYVSGLYTPTGPRKGGEAAHSGEYYEMHLSETFGAHIHDVTKCGEILTLRN
jgi:hypothetical protein